MAKYNVPNYNAVDGFGLPLNIRRGNPNPLDNSEVWSSLAAAENYALTDPTAYVGQEIAVVDVENSKVDRYVIQIDGTLKPSGTEVLGDGYSVEVVDGKIKIVGFADAETGSQPRKKADGTIEWVKPDTTTVDGINTTVEGLVSDVENLSGVVGNAESGLVKDVDDLDGRVSANEAAIEVLNGEGEGSVKKAAEDAATAAVNAFAEKVSDDNVVNTFKELVEYVSTHNGSAATMAADILKNSEAIEALSGKVGEKAVADQITEAIEALQIGDYAKAADLTEALGRIETLESEMDTVEGEISTIKETLEGKVDAVDGERLITDTEAEKLAGIADGAEANVISGVSEEFEVSNDGKILSILSVSQSKIAGLEDALAGKVDKEEGKGLSSNDFTATLLEKLNGIEDGAKANLIEKVTLGGVEGTIIDKTVDVPGASNTILGLVLGAEGENKISVAEDHTMEVNSLNVNRLVQTDGEFLILNGGNSNLVVAN